MNQAMLVPLYMDWSFWAVIVAAIALALSQIPPIHQLVRRARLDVELYSRIFIGHKVGNPNASLHIILRNVGGRNIRVKSITLKITRDGKDIATLPAQNYFQDPNDKNSVLFTSFTLKPKEEWAHMVNFLNFFSREDEKKYRGAESKLKAALLEKRKIVEDKDQLVEAEGDIIVPFIEMFDQKFIWHPGEYKMQVAVFTTIKSADIQKNYRLTLFESDSADLTKVKDAYKSGDGIFWDSGNYPNVFIQIVETGVGG